MKKFFLWTGISAFFTALIAVFYVMMPLSPKIKWERVNWDCVNKCSEEHYTRLICVQKCPASP